jgi:hypothetical protein
MIDPAKWDSKRQTIIGASETVTTNNKKLSAIKLALQQIFDLNLAQRKQISAHEVISQFQGKTKMSYN